MATQIPTDIFREPLLDSVDSGRDLAGFLLGAEHDAEWRQRFLDLWVKQSGPRSDNSRPLVVFAREVPNVLLLNVTGMTDAAFGPERQTAPAFYKQWVELYIGYTNEVLAKEEAEKTAQSDAFTTAEAKRLAHLRTL